MTHQPARVDIADDRHVRFSKKPVGLLFAAPVAGERGKLPHSQSFNEGPHSFVIRRIRSVVSDLGIGENDDLPGIGRIGEDLLIAGYGGIKDNFAVPFSTRTKTAALKDGSVLQGEGSCNQ